MLTENSAEITAGRLEHLAELCRQGHVSETVTKTLNKLFGYEAEKCRTQIRQLETDLSVFERQYGMSSDVFYRRFQEGQTGDDMDFIEWASAVQMCRGLRQRLALLTGEQAGTA
jgi:hypothetical protein